MWQSYDPNSEVIFCVPCRRVHPIRPFMAQNQTNPTIPCKTCKFSLIIFQTAKPMIRNSEKTTTSTRKIKTIPTFTLKTKWTPLFGHDIYKKSNKIHILVTKYGKPQTHQQNSTKDKNPRRFISHKIKWTYCLQPTSWAVQAQRCLKCEIPSSPHHPKRPTPFHIWDSKKPLFREIFCDFWSFCKDRSRTQKNAALTVYKWKFAVLWSQKTQQIHSKLPLKKLQSFQKRNFQWRRERRRGGEERKRKRALPRESMSFPSDFIGMASRRGSIAYTAGLSNQCNAKEDFQICLKFFWSSHKRSEHRLKQSFQKRIPWFIELKIVSKKLFQQEIYLKSNQICTPLIASLYFHKRDLYW